jgi:uncharacterized iron-regulated membrane protein
MMPTAPARPFSIRGLLIRLHRWLGIGAALFWIIQGVTGTLLSFHFELGDAAISTTHRPTDLIAIEQRLDALETPGTPAKVQWIWTTAGLSDRYVVSRVDADGIARRSQIDGAGTMLRDRLANEYTILETVRAIHIDLLAGQAGHWIMAVTGLLLLTNLIFGLVIAWPRGRAWRQALRPLKTGNPVARSYSLHRSVGLWAVAPAVLIAATGTLMLFESDIRDLVDAPELVLPANPATGHPVGLAAAVRAGTAAIPGSHFVGTTMPSPTDASYYLWVRAPGELYREGYGGSLVVVDANDGRIRGAYPATQAKPAQAFVASFYPLHTGEAAGIFGRLLGMATGLWLVVTILFGLQLWLRRTVRRRRAA